MNRKREGFQEVVSARTVSVASVSVSAQLSVAENRESKYQPPSYEATPCCGELLVNWR